MSRNDVSFAFDGGHQFELSDTQRSLETFNMNSLDLPHGSGEATSRTSGQSREELDVRATVPVC